MYTIDEDRLKSSGSRECDLSRGHVQIQGGRARVRSALYMASLSAVRRNAYYRDFYLRLLLRGKAKKAALVAVSRKLLLVLNQMLASSSLWEDSFLTA